MEEAFKFVNFVLWGAGLGEDGVDDEAAGSTLEDEFFF